METDPARRDTRVRPGAIVGGTILLVVGATLLLDRAGLVDTPVRGLIAPFVLIALGSLMMMETGATACGDDRARRRRRGRSMRGVWLVGIGAWLLVSQVHLWGLDVHTSWPLLVILSGLVLLVRGVR